MARILIFSCMQEVSSFNPVPSTFEDFNIGRGQQWLDDRRSINDEIGGALSVFESEVDVEVVPTMGAKAGEPPELQRRREGPECPKEWGPQVLAQGR